MRGKLKRVFLLCQTAVLQPYTNIQLIPSDGCGSKIGYNSNDGYGDKMGYTSNSNDEGISTSESERDEHFNR